MRFILYIALLAPVFMMYSQEYILDSIQSKYPFIKYDINTLKYAENSPSFKRLFHKLDRIKKGQDEDVHVFHIGGSHIQADIYSNRLRHYLQHFNPKAKGQRGFVFPYKMAKTNNPLNYRVEFDGDWQGYRCSRPDSTSWGLAGITAAFRDSISHVKVKANYRNYSDETYDFNKIRIFYDNWTDDYAIEFDDQTLIRQVKVDNKAHFVEYTLNETRKEVDFCIKRKDTSATAEFLMMGMELLNDNRGVEYTSIGVNGASFAFYSRCQYFEEQLLLYRPDLFIISVGTNDTYTTDFKPEAYKAYYEGFIQLIQRANPNCAILLTVPNDSYYKRRYANPNTKLAAQVIDELAQKYKMAVWDFYEIMGGLGSSQRWYRNKLMPKDRIHFTSKGYHIKSDLLLQALVHAWEKETNQPQNSILKLFTEKAPNLE